MVGVHADGLPEATPADTVASTTAPLIFITAGTGAAAVHIGFITILQTIIARGAHTGVAAGIVVNLIAVVACFAIAAVGDSISAEADSAIDLTTGCVAHLAVSLAIIAIFSHIVGVIAILIAIDHPIPAAWRTTDAIGTDPTHTVSSNDTAKVISAWVT